MTIEIRVHVRHDLDAVLREAYDDGERVDFGVTRPTGADPDTEQFSGSFFVADAEEEGTGMTAYLLEPV